MLLVEWIYDNDSRLQRSINTIIDELTSRGVMDPSRLDEQPFNDIAQGPETLFSEAEVDKICNLLDLIRLRAAPVRAA